MFPFQFFFLQKVLSALICVLEIKLTKHLYILLNIFLERKNWGENKNLVLANRVQCRAKGKVLAAFQLLVSVLCFLESQES